jgi:phosphate transport system permease protein
MEYGEAALAEEVCVDESGSLGPAATSFGLGAFFDAVFRGITRFAALLVLGVVVAILVSLVVGSWPALKKFGFGFPLSTAWNPVTEDFGALVAIFGTLVTSTIAMLVAVPVSFGIALFITELAPRWLKRPIGIAIELLAGIPSIIYGMWGLFVFAPLFGQHFQPWITRHVGSWPLVGELFQGPPMGIGIFTASLILAIMVVPFIAAVMRDVFEVVPAALKESAYALGATTWEVVWKVVLPYTKIGVIGGIMLGLGRALGETMAVTFVIGNAHRIDASLFMPGNTISSTLANEFTEAVGTTYTASLFALGLILFLITFFVLAVAKLLLLRLQAREGIRA